MPPGSQTISPDVAFESPHDQKPGRVRTGVSTIRERRSVRERVGWRGLSRYLRRILVVGAHSVLRRAKQNELRTWSRLAQAGLLHFRETAGERQREPVRKLLIQNCYRTNLSTGRNERTHDHSRCSLSLSRTLRIFKSMNELVDRSLGVALGEAVEKTDHWHRRRCARTASSHAAAPPSAAIA